MTTANPYELGPGRNPANLRPLSPLSFLRRTASVYPDRLGSGARRPSHDLARDLRALPPAGFGAGRDTVSGRGDTVAVWRPTFRRILEAHFAVPMIGAVLNALNTRLDAAAIAFMLEHGEAKVLITDREFSGVVGKALQHAGDAGRW